MQAFRERRVRVLVCTDVASRGLDVKDLTHVINYSIPRELDNYVHRIGRTARSGKAGLAWSLVTPSHMGLVSRIEKMTRTRMELGVIPTRKQLGLKKVTGLLEKFQGVASPGRVTELLDASWLAAIEGMSKVEIASRLLALAFPEVFAERGDSQPARLASAHGAAAPGRVVTPVVTPRKPWNRDPGDRRDARPGRAHSGPRPYGR
jgi:ATP-dependent RNA helicase DeaD